MNFNKEINLVIEDLLDEKWESVSAQDELTKGLSAYDAKLKRARDRKVVLKDKLSQAKQNQNKAQIRRIERALHTLEARTNNLKDNRKRVSDEMKISDPLKLSKDVSVGTGRTKYAIEEQCDITNNSTKDLSQLENIISRFYPYVKENLGFKEDAKVNLISDPKNAKDPWGKTAYYNPEAMEITVFVDDRHTKDMLRSLSHELVHHAQNCRGDFGTIGLLEPGYAQKDPHLRRMEGEAYLLGNGFLVRDFEDSLKQICLKQNLTENKTMKGLTREQLETVLTNTFTRILEENKLQKEGYDDSFPANRDEEMIVEDEEVAALAEEDLEESRDVDGKAIGDAGPVEEGSAFSGNGPLAEPIEETFTSQKDQLLFERLTNIWTK